MANYANLKADIQAVIKQNGNQEITGNLLQQSLIAMINSLGNGYLYQGIANPSTNPGTPDQNIFYIATVAGIYVNMGGFTLDDGEVAIIKYNGSWSKDITGIASLQHLTQLDQEINGAGAYVPMPLSLTTGGYYGVTDNTMSETITSREDTSCVKLDVSVGDRFKIYGRGTALIRLYAFTDASNRILLSNDGLVNYRGSGLVLDTPPGATKLFINFYLYDSSQDKLEQYIAGDGLKQQVEGLQESLSELESAVVVLNTDISRINKRISGDSYYAPIELTLTTDNYRGINTTLNTVNANLTSRAGTNCADVDVLPGDKFKLFGKGSGAICLYIFADANRNILLRNTTLINTRADGIEVVAPENATKLHINFLDYLATDKAEKFIINAGIEQRVEELEAASEDIEQRVEDLEDSSGGLLKNKTFIAFGDSITEFKWPAGSGGDNKGWIEHTEEILGCHIINCAVGGTHMNAARYCELFDPSHNYSVDAYVFYKPATTMNLYKCINAHSGAWVSSDFEDVSETDAINNVAYAPLNIYRMIQAYCNISVINPDERFKNQIAAAECIYTWKPTHDDNRAIVERLKNVNPVLMDGLIIEEGTNDYAAASERGTSGSFDITKTLGATNQAISDICSTFKKYAVFYITPPIRWWGWSNGSGELANFSDFYRANGDGDITLREWVAILKNEYQLNHIPVCDIYNELGWNQYNFSNYFPDNDGTHPRPGFKNIGAKVASFLLSMNVLKPVTD